MSEAILLVRHGAGRGRIPGYWDEALEHVARHHPRLWRRLRLHRTGEPLPGLDDVGAAVFWLGDPLEEHYPRCFEEASEIASRVPHVVNPPDALSNTIKSRQASLWREAGLPTPPSRSFRARDELEAILDRIRYPVLLRPDREHSASSLHLCRSREEALSVPDDRLTYPGTATGFVDVRSSYRSTLPETLWARYHHKKRAFVFGETVVPGHMYFSSAPFVRAAESTLALHSDARDFVRDLLDDVPRWDRRLGLSQKLLRLVPTGRTARRSIRRELHFATSAPGRPDLMRKAARVLGLECVALDYSVRADGRVVLWEANPYPWLTPWRGGILPTRRRLRDRNARLFDALAGFLTGLVESDAA